MADSPIHSINAVTLATQDMGLAIAFYEALGFKKKYGDPQAQISSFYCGESFLNIVKAPSGKKISWWGRVIFHVDDVDAMFARFKDNGFTVETEPRDAEWGERYFHALDGDGHELSFAKFLA